MPLYLLLARSGSLATHRPNVRRETAPSVCLSPFRRSHPRRALVFSQAERAADLQEEKAKEEALAAERKSKNEEQMAEQQRMIEKEQRKRMKAKRAERRKENAALGIVEPELESDSEDNLDSLSATDEEAPEADAADTEAAARKIQAMQRGKNARSEMRDQQDAATKMQAVQRGRKGRVAAQERKQDSDAATKVQAMQRGRQSRREVEEKRAEADKLRAMEEEEQAAAAAKIQAQHRGKLARKEMEEQQAAATKLQAMQRGKMTRKEQELLAVANAEADAAKEELEAAEAAERAAEEEERAAATKIQAIMRGNATRRELTPEPVAVPVPLPEPEAEPTGELVFNPAEEDQFEEGPEPAFGEISLHERQEALLHVLAAHKDDPGADSETAWSETASQMSTLPAGQRARQFFGSIGEYSVRKTQEHRTKEEATFENLGKVEQMLLGAGRMHEAAQIRTLAHELANSDADTSRHKAAKKEISSDKFLRFLQNQAQSRSEDVLMGKIKDTMYEEDPNNLSRLPPIAQAQGSSPEEIQDGAPAPNVSEYGTRLPAIAQQSPAPDAFGGASPEASGENDAESMLVDAELLKYWESVAGEAPEGVDMPSMFSTGGGSKKAKKTSENTAPTGHDGHQTFDQYKADIKERKTGTGALSRPLHGINSVDKSFYGLIHESDVGGLIREDTRENWSQLTRSLATAGGTNKSAAVVARAVEEVGTQGRDMYAPPKATVKARSRVGHEPSGPGAASMNTTGNASRRPNSRSKRKAAAADGSGERVSPDYFLKQCMAMALKAGVDPDEQQRIVQRFETHNVDIECSDADGNALLLLVAGNKDVDVGLFKLLLQSGSVVHSKNNEADSVLHQAARVGNEPVARVLLGIERSEYGTEKGPGLSKKPMLPVDIENLYDETPLHLAARAGQGDFVQMLLDQGADPDNESGKSQTPLLAGAEAGQEDACARLIKWGAAINFEDNEGACPLHKATRCGSLPIVKMLMEVEADVNAAESDGFTALHWAANQGHIVILNLLCDKGANVNTSDEDGETPLHRAVACGHPEIVAELMKRGARVDMADTVGRTTTHKAANAGDLNVMKLVLSKKAAMVNARDDQGVTALHLACAHGHAAVGAVLLKHGAIVDLEDSSGRTPLHYAANGDFPKMAKLLMQHHAQVNYEDCEGWTPLHWAAKKDSCDLGAVLLEGGADKDWKDLKGMSPMHRAVCNDMVGFAMMLVRSKCDVNARDSRGRTPLNRSVSNRRHECTSVLIEGGADINAKDSWGHTALHRAVAVGDVETAAQLCSIGGEVNSPDVEQRTPLMWAADRLDEEMVRMLLSQGADATLKDCNGQLASGRASDSESVLLLLEEAERHGGGPRM